MTIVTEPRSESPRRWSLAALAGAVVLALTLGLVATPWETAEDTSSRAGSTDAPMTSGQATLIKDQFLAQTPSSEVPAGNAEVILFKDSLQPDHPPSKAHSNTFAEKDHIEAVSGTTLRRCRTGMKPTATSAVSPTGRSPEDVCSPTK